MVNFWQSCDAGILVSLREGMPKALLEAAASGLPLIATNVVGCRDVVSDGVNGYLVVQTILRTWPVRLSP